MYRALGLSSIRGRIIVSFVLFLACTIGLGVFSISRSEMLSDTVAQISSNLKATKILTGLSAEAESLRSNSYALAAADEPSEEAAATQAFVQAFQVIEKGWADYVATDIDPGQEQNYADAVQAAWKDYTARIKKLQALAKTGTEHEKHEYLSGDLSTSAIAYRSALEKSLGYQNDDSAQAVSKANATTALTRSLTIGVLCTLALVVLLVGWLMIKSISQPISQLSSVMRKLAGGDLTASVPGIGRSDEIGEMAGAVQVFKDSLIKSKTLAQEREDDRAMVEAARSQREAAQERDRTAVELVVAEIGNGIERLSAGDLAHRMQTVLPGVYDKLRTNLNAAMAQLQTLVSSIIENSATLRSGTQEITAATDDLARRTEQQAAGLEETAAALGEITGTVRKTADGAKQANAVVARTRVDAEKSGDIVRQAVAAMGSIENSSKQIGQIIGVIDEIAFQTNLLALNAGVEAARAGEAGRGFAVVASEVRALAQRSAEAAKEIKALISTSAQQVESGVKLVGETGQALERIVAQVAEITSVVSEIAASAQEQADGLNQVNIAINQMDQVTQQNAAMVEQSSSASRTLAEGTEELVRLTEQFQVGKKTRQRAA
jgi:methyl-accepting chemotaxis protein